MVKILQLQTPVAGTQYGVGEFKLRLGWNLSRWESG